MLKLVWKKAVETFTQILSNKDKEIRLLYNSDMYDYRDNSDTLSSIIEYLNSLAEYCRYTNNTEYGLLINTDKISSKTISNLDFIVRNLIHYPNHILIVNDKNVKDITKLTENAVQQLTKLGVKFNG